MLRPILASALVLATVCASAQKTESEVRAVYSQMNALFAKRDIKGTLALFDRTATPDFVSQMGSQKMGRAQFMADIKKGMTAKDFPTVVTKVLSTKASGNALMVSVQWDAKGKGPGGKPYAIRSVSTDTWVKTAKGYRLKKNYEAKPPQPM